MKQLIALIVALPFLARGNDMDNAQTMAAAFAPPPASARPWVYWFWLNGNITSEGITADLEAMQRVGIGGVLIMEVGPGRAARAGRLRRAAVAGAVQACLLARRTGWAWKST